LLWIKHKKATTNKKQNWLTNKNNITTTTITTKNNNINSYSNSSNLNYNYNNNTAPILFGNRRRLYNGDLNHIKFFHFIISFIVLSSFTFRLVNTSQVDQFDTQHLNYSQHNEQQQQQQVQLATSTNMLATAGNNQEKAHGIAMEKLSAQEESQIATTNKNISSTIETLAKFHNISTLNEQPLKLPPYIRTTAMSFCIIIMILGGVGNIMVSFSFSTLTLLLLIWFRFPSLLSRPKICATQRIYF